MLVGIDDTDSPKGMCTTYLAALICSEFSVKDVPRLIRLNPNIPYRTRGNGAVAFEVDDSANAKERILELFKEYSHVKEKNTNPGLVFLEEKNREALTPLRDLYRRAVSEHVTIGAAVEAAKKVGAEVHRLKNGRGLIGALAAVGADLSGDKTYELIAYRIPRNYGSKRRIDVGSVFEMNEELYPKVFDSVDSEVKRVLITPRGPDPVFCGIRGEGESYVREGWSLVKPLEEIERVMVFQTNQATDAHLRRKSSAEVNPFDCLSLEGVVENRPRTIGGGHVIFALKDESGVVDCAAYKPTGGFRDVVRGLIPGDVVMVYGGVSKYPKTVNLEKIRVISLAEERVIRRPECCGKLMTSAGKGKGYKCRKCGSRKSVKSVVGESKSRALSEGFYEVPPRARRHLSKPLVRCSTLGQ